MTDLFLKKYLIPLVPFEYTLFVDEYGKKEMA
jgi:hypothetical protein